MTPLSFAAYSGNFASVLLLDKHGAKAKQKDEKVRRRLACARP